MSNAQTANTPSPDSQAAPQAGSVSIARQAIVDDKGKVYGYELFDRSRPFSSHDASSDAQLLFNVLSQAETASLMGKRLMFVNCTHQGLTSEHLELVQPERIVLEIPPVAGNAAAAISAILPDLADVRGRGFSLAFNHTVLTAAYEPWLPMATYIKIDLAVLKPELVEPVIKLALKKKPDAKVIVEKIETAEQHKKVAALGVKLFQGYWFAKPIVVTSEAIRPAHAVIIQLINLVRKQAPTDQIEAVLKRDASLSFNLLRYINSSGFGLSTEITSFRHW